MRKYRYLTFADRKQISAWYQSNDRAADIAERLRMSVKTIYLELKRGEETKAGPLSLTATSGPHTTPFLPSRGYKRTSSGAGASRRRKRQKRRGHKPAKIKQEVLTVTEFERITESTETLAAFLASLPCIEGPWNEAFHERFCNYCPAKDCDNCQYEEYRNNPLWWLKLRDEPSEGTKQAAKRLADLVKRYSALEAAELLDISLNAAKILNEEKDIDWAMAISAAQSIGIYDRG